jgi:hypothetical protein
MTLKLYYTEYYILFTHIHLYTHIHQTQVVGGMALNNRGGALQWSRSASYWLRENHLSPFNETRVREGTQFTCFTGTKVQTLKLCSTYSMLDSRGRQPARASITLPSSRA